MQITRLKPAKLPFFTQRPNNLLVFFYLLCMVIVWTVLMAISHQAPDLDGMEELVWAASLELGYTKHPPLPSWFMYLATEIFGRKIWLPFFMGQLFSALGLWFIWLLGKEITTPYKAFIATLLVSATAYFSLRATIYNHNTAQLWSITASIWLYYCALTKEKLKYWIYLGLVCGLAMLTKYSALIQFAAFFLFFIRAGSWRKKSVWLGVLAALICFSIVITPHLIWLIDNNFAPLHYADSALATNGYLDSIVEIIWFSLDQLGRISPMLIALAASLVWYYKKADKGPGGAANDASFNTAIKPLPYYYDFKQFDKSFLLWVGLAPFLSTIIVSAVFATALEASWGSTFFVLTGFYALWLLRGNQAIQIRRVLIITIALHLSMAIAYAIARGPIAQATGHTARSTFPGPEIAALGLKHWQEHQPGRPLRVVVANTWLGGNIAVNVSPKTQVYIDAEDAKSPWFKPGQALACGALIVYSKQGKGPASANTMKLYEQAPWHGTDYVMWSGPKGKQIDINWAVLPATDKCLQQ